MNEVCFKLIVYGFIFSLEKRGYLKYERVLLYSNDRLRARVCLYFYFYFFLKKVEVAVIINVNIICGVINLGLRTFLSNKLH